MIPMEFRQSVLNLNVAAQEIPLIDKDKYCLAMVKNYNSLMPLAQEARKPIFKLKSADGAIGAHANAVQGAYADFKWLAAEIAMGIALKMPTITV
jgi:hypothetical protein